MDQSASQERVRNAVAAAGVAMIRLVIATVVLALASSALRAQFPALPVRIGGTVTVDGALLSATTTDQYEFRVTQPTTGALVASTVGLTPTGGFAVDVPTFDAISQPNGVTSGTQVVIAVLRNGQTLPLTQPSGGIVTVGGPGTLTVVNLVLTTARGRLINLSILALLASGETMTMGTVLGGAGTSGTKALLARAAGPSLTQLGVSGVLPNPTMTFNNTSASPAIVVATNAGWGGTTTLSNAFAAVGAFPYVSTTSKDSAIFQQSLTAGNYTVQVRDAIGAAGTVITELYDSTPGSAFTAATPRLINVSVLKQIAAGSSLTAGFVIGGTGSVNVLLRAVGPTLGLAPFNISGVMANPKLELLNNATGQSLNVNIGWGGSPTLTAAFASVGAFQLANANTKDSVLLVTLSPGQYSARVSSSDGSGGIAIVEIYEAP